MILRFYLKSIIRLLLAFILITSCVGEGNDKAFPNESFLYGQRLYATHCQSCHQQDGLGFKSLYPPLANSDYLNENEEHLPCIIKKGLKGKIMVNGKEYDQTMPGNDALTSEEIRDIIIYLNNSWGKTEGDLPLKEVKASLKRCE